MRGASIAAATVGAGALVLGGVVVADAATTARTVKVCTTKKGVVVSATKSGKCRKGLKKVTLNTRGPVGSRGPVGPRGATGPAGTTAFGNGTGTFAAGKGTECTIGEVRLFAGAVGTGVPANGQVLPIAQNTALFSLLGTTYGGNGQTTFALPDLRAAAPDGMTYFLCVEGVFPSRD
ncbi:phage tail protein [Mumia sp. ZJ1417]|uniref:phage tail protein n=1 Tax=Mumia sp. ZJ1417 TaxID=2708082 RepID=UPI001AB03364|nr:tail fiber protein [Mumia sp. ZJ1417]